MGREVENYSQGAGIVVKKGIYQQLAEDPGRKPVGIY